jgi:glycosyltransferase involved in cell wall biosynthesis
VTGDDQRPRIAIVSREVWPFYEGGGIGRHVHGTAELLAGAADVTVVQPDMYRGTIASDDPRLPDGVRYAFAHEPTPEQVERFRSVYHAWSAAACEELRRLYPDGGPDLIESAEYTGEAAVTVQARRSGDPAFARTRVAIRFHGSDEIHRSLNGESSADPEGAAIVALERIALAGADVMLAPAGGATEAYERLYADTGLPPIRAARYPVTLEASPQPAAGGHPRPLRILHLGRLERRKGVEDLVRAAVSVDDDRFTVTLIGRDTPTGPGGGSMLEHLKRIAAGDPRIRFQTQVSHDRAMAAIVEHDVMAVVSRWEALANTVRESLALGRPVLANRVGALSEVVEEGVTGWFTDEPGPAALAIAIQRLLDDRAAVDELVGSTRVSDGLSKSVANDEAVRDMLDEATGERPAPPAELPDVGITIIARDGGGSVADTLGSLSRQTRPPDDVAIVCQGVHAARAATTFAAAHGAHVGREIAHGDLIALVEAGTELAPGYVERVARAAAADPGVECITTWSNAEDAGTARPFGVVPMLDRDDCIGEVLALRAPLAAEAVATLVSAEVAGAGPWLVGRQLLADRRRGVVVPEELVTARWEPGHGTSAERRSEVDATLVRKRLGIEHQAPTPALPRRRITEAAPVLSVLMAAYNAEDTIRASVETALGQAEERLEVIVVDDGSQVPVAEVLADLADPRLRIVRHAKNRGFPSARTTALGWARGEFVAQLDADDLWAPEYASTVLPAFEDPEVGLVYSNARILGHPDGLELYIPDASVHPMDRFPQFAEQNPVPSLTAAMRTEAVRAAGGYAWWMGPAIDYHLYGKLIMGGWRFAYVDRPLAWYRWPEPSRGMSYDHRRTQLAELRLWLAFALRHPRLPGPKRQVRVRLRREVERLRFPR